MPLDTEDTGFISRWSRRKVMVRQGVAVAEVAEPVVANPPLPLAPVAHAPVEVLATPAEAAAQPVPEPAPDAPPQPTLDDVAALTHESDYSRFVGRSVQPDVRNAALSKLFTDPHFNVMDRLDTYIDDYGKPDPLPPGMLRQMLQAHTLGLFDDEDEQNKTALANAPQTEDVAAPPTESGTNENTDLQLQPDDGTGCTGPEPSLGEDTGGQHGRAGDGPQPPVPA